MSWTIIAVLAVGTLVFKTLGPLLAGGAEPPAPIARVIELLTPALLASLVVSSTFGANGLLVIDARAAGVSVGLLLLWPRVPVVFALLAAAVVTALAGAVA